MTCIVIQILSIIDPCANIHGHNHRHMVTKSEHQKGIVIRGMILLSWLSGKRMHDNNNLQTFDTSKLIPIR